MPWLTAQAVVADLGSWIVAGLTAGDTGSQHVEDQVAISRFTEAQAVRVGRASQSLSIESLLLLPHVELPMRIEIAALVESAKLGDAVGPSGRPFQSDNAGGRDARRHLVLDLLTGGTGETPVGTWFWTC